MYEQHMILKISKLMLNYTLNKYHVHWLSSFKHFKLPISIKIPVTICLHDSYITKFNFMNYAFAKLVVAWLYIVFVQYFFLIYHGLIILNCI